MCATVSSNFGHCLSCMPASTHSLPAPTQAGGHIPCLSPPAASPALCHKCAGGPWGADHHHRRPQLGQVGVDRRPAGQPGLAARLVLRHVLHGEEGEAVSQHCLATAVLRAVLVDHPSRQAPDLPATCSLGPVCRASHMRLTAAEGAATELCWPGSLLLTCSGACTVLRGDQDEAKQLHPI